MISIFRSVVAFPLSVRERGKGGKGEGWNGGKVKRVKGGRWSGCGVWVWVWGGRGGKKKLKKSGGTQKFLTPPKKKKSIYYYDDCA